MVNLESWAKHNSLRRSIPEHRQIAIGHRRHLAFLEKEFELDAVDAARTQNNELVDAFP